MEGPGTPTARWSIGLGAAFIALFISRLLTDVELSIGALNVGASLLLIIGFGALFTGVAALRAGERSRWLWVGLVPGILAALLLLVELLFFE